jgi:hypothetical protein
VNFSPSRPVTARRRRSSAWRGGAARFPAARTRRDPST